MSKSSIPDQEMLAVSVVIPCFNAAVTLSEQLDALLSQTTDVPFEVIVVDNGSTDGTVLLASSYVSKFPALRVISAVEYQGAGFARNEGVRVALTEKILFCDGDDIVSSVWVAEMSAALDLSDIVGGGRDYLQLSDDNLMGLHVCSQSEDILKVCDVHFSGKQRFAHFGAGNMAIRRSVFKHLGGFDLELPIHEDADLCIRAQLLGYKLGYCPRALLYIRVRQQLGPIFHQSRAWGYWSVAFDKKHCAVIGHPPILRPLCGWPLLVLRVIRIRCRQDLYHFIYRVGWKCGRLCGSVMMGFFAL